MTWVITEHEAAGTSELSVTKGQQVEVLESQTGREGWCLVRLPSEPPQQGLVPIAVLKPQPKHHTSPNKKQSQQLDETIGKFVLYCL